MTDNADTLRLDSADISGSGEENQTTNISTLGSSDPETIEQEAAKVCATTCIGTSCA